MSLQFDPETSEIKYNDKVIGRYDHNNRTVRIYGIEYTAKPEEWMIPLSWFAHGLSKLDLPQASEIVLTVTSKESDILEEFESPQYLIEKTIKQDGYIWRFHKSDPDNWPSEIHGHDYKKNLVLDAITGNIYDKTTRCLIKALKDENIKEIQNKLRKSDDFKEKCVRLIKN